MNSANGLPKNFFTEHQQDLESKMSILLNKVLELKLANEDLKTILRTEADAFDTNRAYNSAMEEDLPKEDDVNSCTISLQNLYSEVQPEPRKVITFGTMYQDLVTKKADFNDDGIHIVGNCFKGQVLPRPKEAPVRRYLNFIYRERNLLKNEDIIKETYVNSERCINNL